MHPPPFSPRVLRIVEIRIGRVAVYEKEVRVERKDDPAHLRKAQNSLRDRKMHEIVIIGLKSGLFDDVGGIGVGVGREAVNRVVGDDEDLRGPAVVVGGLAVTHTHLQLDRTIHHF